MAVAIEDVGDQESLDAYLRALPGDKRRAVSLRVAVRAAARVLPIAALYFAEKNGPVHVELTAATVFGALAIAAVAAVSPTAAIGYAKAAANASGATAVGTNVAATFAAANVATYGAAASANAATFATVAASLAAIAAAATLAAIATDAAKAAASANKAAYRVDLWPQVRSDLRGDDWSAIALAPEIRAMWEDAKTALSKDTHDWRIWINWYDRLIANRNWHPDAMAAELTKITDADWRKGPAHINPMFNKVLAVYEAEDEAAETTNVAAKVQQIIDATPQGEEVAFDFNSRKFALVPTDQIDESFLPNILDQIDEAASIFDHTDESVNQFAALVPEILKLRQIRVRYADRPVMILKRVHLIELRIDSKILGGLCPTAAQDENIAELKTTLRDVQVELIAFSEEVKKYYQSKPLALVDDVLPNVQEGAKLLAAESTDALKDALEEEVTILVDPEATDEEKRTAFSRIVGLVARGSKAAEVFLERAAKNVKNVTIVSSGVAGVGGIYAWYNSPAFAETVTKIIQAIMAAS